MPQLPNLLAKERLHGQTAQDKPFVAHEHVLLSQSGYVEFHNDHTQIALEFLFGCFTSTADVSQNYIEMSSSQRTSRRYPRVNTEYAHPAWSYSTTCTLQLGQPRSDTFTVER